MTPSLHGSSSSGGGSRGAGRRRGARVLQLQRAGCERDGSSGAGDSLGVAGDV